MTTTRYLPAAYSCAAVLKHVLQNELRLMPPVRFVLTETPEGKAYLFAVMDEINIGKSITRYTNQALIHQLSTALKGRPVYLSNTTGLRYGVLLSPAMQLPKSSLYPGSVEGQINIGLTAPQTHLVLQPQEMQNILLTGDQGSGKSNLLRLLAVTALENDWQLYLADPEENTFGGSYWDSVCLSGKVAGSQMDFIDLIDRINQMLIERSRLYQSVTTGMISPNNLFEYNARAAEPLKRVLVIVDEANSYTEDKEISKRLFDLARRARKWGINLVLAAHSWRSSDVPTSLRGMLKTRIALPTQEATSVEVVLNNKLWEKKVLKFRDPGRGIIRYNGKFMTFQSHLIPDDYQINGQAALPALSGHDGELLKRAMQRAGEDQGKVDIVFAMQTLNQPRRFVLPILEEMEVRKLIEKRADKANARYITEKGLQAINLEA